MQRYLAPLFMPAFLSTSPIATPVQSALETPAAPQEKPFVFRTTFCSFRLLPAQTRVTGHVICSYSAIRSLSLIVIGFSTKLWLGLVHESTARIVLLTLLQKTPNQGYLHPQLEAQPRGF